MDYDENNLFDNCRFVADVMKTRQDLRFQALRLIHYVIYRVICDDEDLQTFTGSVTELAEAFHIQRSNIYRDIDSLSAQLHSTGMILGHKDPRKSWRTVTWLSRSCYNGRGTILIKLSYSMVSYVKGIRHMFSDDFHKTILKFNSVYAIRIYEIISADRFFHKDADSDYELQKFVFCLLLQASINGFPMRFLSAFCFACFCILWGGFVAFHPKLTPNSPQESPQESPHGQRQCRRLQRTDLHFFCRCQGRQKSNHPSRKSATRGNSRQNSGIITGSPQIPLRYLRALSILFLCHAPWFHQWRG